MFNFRLFKIAAMKYSVLTFCFALLSVFGFSQKSFQEILEGNTTRNFGEIVAQAEQYFQDKYPGKSALDLSQGEHRDGEFVKYMRWRTFWKPRLENDGTLADLSKFYSNQSEDGLDFRSTGTYDNLNWKNISYRVDLGVQIGLGRTNSIAFHPTDSNTFYVAAAIGGIWKTTDGGQSYTALGDDLPYLAVSAIVVNQNNPSHIYIAISDRVWYGPSSIGVYRSVDGGNTWQETALTFEFAENVRIYWMEAKPDNPAFILVGTSDGLYKTDDAFESVSQIAVGRITDVKYKPGDPNTAYYVGTDPNRFYRSSDGGNSFELMHSFDGNSYMRLVTTPLDSEKIYISRANALHKSFDSGQSFLTSVALNSAGVGDGIVMFSPIDDGVLYAGFFDMFRSDNGGFSFTQISHWLGNFSLPLIHVDQRNAFVNPLQSNLIYLCNDGGVYTLNVSSGEFSNLSNGLQITQFFDIGVAQSNPAVMSGGSQDNGNVFMEEDDWFMAAPTADGMVQAIDFENENIRYNAIQLGQIFRFVDGDRTNISNNIPGGANGNGEWVTPYILVPGMPQNILAAYNKVYKSTNRGDSWSAISPELAPGRNLDLIAAAPSNPEKIYVVENYGINTGDLFGLNHNRTELFVKNTENEDWTTIDLPFTESVEDILIHPSNEDHLFVCLAGYTPDHKVFESFDGGESWTNISGSLPNAPATSIALYERDSMVLFLGTDAGVFYKEDMSDWSLAGKFPHTYVTDIEIQEASQLIRVATHGRGIFEGNLDPNVTDGEDLEPPVSNCFNVYPNPAHDQVLIADFSAVYEVQLFDVQGRLLTTTTEAELDISNFPQGLYYLRFVLRKTGQQYCVRKFIKQ